MPLGGLHHILLVLAKATALYSACAVQFSS